MSGCARGAVLFDLDGTLIDSNYQHAMAWYLAFREGGVVLPMWRIHRHIGMGGDQIVPALIGEARAEQLGDQLRAAEKEEFKLLLDQISPLEGAHELLTALKDRGHELVLASSSPKEYLERYLDLLDAHDLIDAATTSEDVEATKPAPDLIDVAKQKAHSPAVTMIGDSPWDIQAAARADMPCIALLTGGYSRRELTEAGAEAVFESLVELHQHIEETSLNRTP
jgi:HAD superfamily hydrolase (TIGR01549 family)